MMGFSKESEVLAAGQDLSGEARVIHYGILSRTLEVYEAFLIEVSCGSLTSLEDLSFALDDFVITAKDSYGSYTNGFSKESNVLAAVQELSGEAEVGKGKGQIATRIERYMRDYGISTKKWQWKISRNDGDIVE
ncbi:hypothetical protein RDI58_001537 [Solanum bulbocastanum]|uniref:Uncharacterized protein n=1 Tax=Solanum bulbocastanum TaxID=147425 RepID=A0AAN8U873_SOLBU